MPLYQAPVRELLFVLNELLDFPEHYRTVSRQEELTPDLVQAIIEEAAKFCEKTLHPLNMTGDCQGCTLSGDEVKTPVGFKEAYQEFVDSGWPALAHSTDFGGQGLPESLSLVIDEMMATANWAWSMYAFLSHGSKKTLEMHGSAEQQRQYLPRLISGQWTGTMCLTESQCGTDLGLIKTRAEPENTGESYFITGEKIFISSGEHDLSENIIHIVLARLANAPEGTRGLSLFLVPKYITDDNGEITQRNKVKCIGIESKMGIHGNATCSLSFEKATGFLIGEPNKGLSYMFTFMNIARIGTGIQGLAHSEFAYQNALAYCQERLQMRSLNGAVNPDGPADPIIVHPDVRRMLLTIKTLNEGNRALLYYVSAWLDIAEHARLSGDNEKEEKASAILALLTPIAKAFVTETGFEAANLGLQCFGGHGYIREWGMEQNLRDSRISTLYEGTTGIQSLDLLGRKVLSDRGKALKIFLNEIKTYCRKEVKAKQLKTMKKELLKLCSSWEKISLKIALRALKNKDEIGAASVDYLMFSGYVCLAFFWLKSATVAHTMLTKQSEDSRYYTGKMLAAEFFYLKILPRATMHHSCIETGSACLMTLSGEQF